MKGLEQVLKVFNDLTLYGLEKLGLYYSRYRGWVVDTEDPKGLHRIKINVPEIYGDGVPNIWAWPACNFSGNGYGIQCLPSKGDLVWVQFEKGNSKKPLWSFGYFGKGNIPEDLEGSGKYWFRTPKGLTILIDDNNETITQYKKDGTVEPMILGDKWKKNMEDLIDILKEAKINTNLGPQGLLPPFLTRLDTLKNSLTESLSEVNKLS